jgi:large subunit ribosomal protein L22
MTKVKAQVKWVRIAPRKLGRVTELVRGKPAVEALALLRFMPQKGARILENVLKSAVANARNNYKLTEQNLVITEAYVNKGITMRRWQAKARGRIHPLQKRTSHLTVWLSSPSAPETESAKPAPEKKARPSRARPRSKRAGKKKPKEES